MLQIRPKLSICSMLSCILLKLFIRHPCKNDIELSCFLTLFAAASSIVPVTLVEMVPAATDSPLDLPLPSTELKGYCQESCTIDGCDLPLFKPGNKSLNMLHADMTFCVLLF